MKPRGWPPLVQEPYSKAMFSTQGTLVWTVDAADYYVSPWSGLWWAVLGKMMFISFQVDATTTSGAGHSLGFNLPQGLRAASQLITVPGTAWHTNGGNWALGQLWTGTAILPGGSRSLRVTLANTGNWSANTNNLYIRLAAMVPLE